MAREEDRATAKRLEIEALVASSLRDGQVDDAEHVAEETVRQFITVTAPVSEPPRMGYMTLREGGIGGGSTTKPGNVVLNLANLVRAIAGGTLTITGASASPWTLLIGALVTWDSLWSCLRLHIGEHDACVAWALWVNRDAHNTIAKADVIDAVAGERRAFGKQRLDSREIEDALRNLQKMRCIQQSGKNPDRWWLREWVAIKYD